METLLEKVISLDFKVKGNGSRWKNTEEHSSLVLDIENQIWFWNSKELSGSPIDYLTKVKGLSKKDATKLLNELKYVEDNSIKLSTKKEVVVPNEKLVSVFWRNGLVDREYWYKRCLTDSTIDRFKLGKYDGFFTLPLYVENQFMNFQCRRDTPEKQIRPWYKGIGPLLFNSGILKFTDIVFITEGPVDAILLNQLGFPAVSHTGGATGWNNNWFPNFLKQKRIYYIADNDPVGYRGADIVAKSLGESRVKIISFPDKKEHYDFVDFIRDGNTVEDFKALIEKSKYSFEMRKNVQRI